MKIVLKDGTEIKNAMIGKLNDQLIELSMSKADGAAYFQKFIDPSVMSEIEYHSGIWKTVFKGFSRFSSLENPHEDEMRVWMESDGNATVSDPIPLVDEMYIPKGDN